MVIDAVFETLRPLDPLITACPRRKRASVLYARQVLNKAPRRRCNQFIPSFFNFKFYPFLFDVSPVDVFLNLRGAQFIKCNPNKFRRLINSEFTFNIIFDVILLLLLLCPLQTTNPNNRWQHKIVSIKSMPKNSKHNFIYK
jgi:hypothetical protein